MLNFEGTPFFNIFLGLNLEVLHLHRDLVNANVFKPCLVVIIALIQRYTDEQQSLCSIRVESQLIRFARASSYVADFNARNKSLTQKLLNEAIGITNFTKPFLNFIDDTMI